MLAQDVRRHQSSRRPPHHVANASFSDQAETQGRKSGPGRRNERPRYSLPTAISAMTTPFTRHCRLLEIVARRPEPISTWLADLPRTYNHTGNPGRLPGRQKIPAGGVGQGRTAERPRDRGRGWSARHLPRRLGVAAGIQHRPPSWSCGSKPRANPPQGNTKSGGNDVGENEETALGNSGIT